MKICSKCKKEKELTNFGKDKYSPDGYNYRCKDCVKVIRKKTYFKRKDKILSDRKNLAAKNKLKQTNLNDVKLCIGCNIKLNVINFWKDNHKPDGLRTYCKKRIKKHRKEN